MRLGLGFAALVATSLSALAAPEGGTKPLSFLHADGVYMVDEAGQRMTLRGCNLGNWLVIESWMLGWEIEDQYTLVKVLSDRFGEAEADRIMEAYRDGYIRPRDFEVIKSFGFNLVRVPFDYRRLMDEQGRMRADAFKWLDRAVDMAEGAGMYAILDLHAPPGGQSTADHTGRRDQNKLWTDPVAQKRMVELWRNIAQHFKGRGAVAGYDLLNEPYGDFHTDLRAKIHDIALRSYQAVRSTGDKHVVIFPNALGQGVSFHGDMKGLSQFAFTDHYYPGLFGSPSTVMSHVETLDRTMPEAADYLKSVGGPMLIGEFNVVLEKAGGKPMMRRYYDEFARRGWMATMWSYKIVKPTGGVESDNWYMATNAEPFTRIDPRKSEKAEIEKFVAGLPEMPLAVDETLRDVLTRKDAPSLPWPRLEALPQKAPAARSVGAWTLTDVECTVRGGLEAAGDGITVVSAGGDIFSTRDSFGLVHQRAPESAVLVASVAEFLNSDVWAKAGLMARFGEPNSPDFASAPFVMVNVFPDGTVATVVREKSGAAAREEKRIVGPLPANLALVRNGARIETYAGAGDGSWLKLGSATIASGAPAQVGLAVASHHRNLLTRARFEEVSLRPTGTLEGKVVDHANPQSVGGENLLKDGSFEEKGAWGRFGETLQVAEASAAHGGSSVARQSGGPGESGLWQDVKVTPGKRYRFAVYARATSAGEGSVRLSLESTVNGKQVALAERTCEAKALEAEGGWSLLDVGTVAPTDRLRVVVRVGSDRKEKTVAAPALELDDASLVEARP